jgi:hypothetical protein
MRIFGQLFLVDKQKVPYLYKTTSKEFQLLHKSYAQRRSQDFWSGGGAAKIEVGPTNFPHHSILNLPVYNFFGKKTFPDNNITIAFVVLFPISVSLFPMLHHEDSDNIEPALKIHWQKTDWFKLHLTLIQYILK